MILEDRYYKPSANEETAKKGVIEFASLLTLLPKNAKQLLTGSAPARPYHFKFIDVKRCVTGISAEIAFDVLELPSFPKEAFIETEEVLNNQTQHFFFYRREKLPQCYHLFNLLAVQQVATNYPEYFPAETRTDTRNWLQNNWLLWADGTGMNCIRYGLLSGFPLEATLRFSENKQAKDKRHVRSEKTNLSYFGFNEEKDQKYIKQLDAIFSFA